MIEDWLHVPGTNSLYASSLGRLKGPKGIVKGTLDKKGYRHSATLFGKEERTYSFHRVICSAFHPNPDDLPEVNHIDGNKDNNRPDNLEWCDRLHNIRHMVRTTGHRVWEHARNRPQGSAHHAATMDEAMVRTIRAFPEGMTSTSIAKQVGLNRRTVNSVRLGRTWKHVT